ncbi:hypothetical protein BJ508DRAFT_336430 [Ascobolus immersus RN42]|uniref:Uncharacterized protein n=1 Tax=Ascobolus immersus RN42 TaxID=1160509 RepID=A0A3N4H8I6_ASCIM|nr:hypothetical protein BJ508DRAFT_336430 [Ascobolus immersus RN42]
MKAALGSTVVFPEVATWGKFEFGVTTDGSIGVVFTALSSDGVSCYSPRINHGWVHDGPQCENVKELLIAGHAVYGFISEFLDCSSYGNHDTVSSFNVIFGICNKQKKSIRELPFVQGLSVSMADALARGQLPSATQHLNNEFAPQADTFRSVSEKDSAKVEIEVMKNQKRKRRTLEARAQSCALDFLRQIQKNKAAKKVCYVPSRTSPIRGPCGVGYRLPAARLSGQGVALWPWRPPVYMSVAVHSFMPSSSLPLHVYHVIW